MHLARRERTRLQPENLRLPLIALIDVVLFILFYFVVSYSVSGEEHELGTTLAMAGRGAPGALAPHVVRVEWTGDAARFSVGADVVTDTSALTRALEALPRERGVVIVSAAGAPVEATARAIQAGRDAGFERITYALPPAPDGAP